MTSNESAIITRSDIRLYDFTDNSSRYTLSIRNDLGVANGIPALVGNDKEPNFIHTWLVLTDLDNPDNPVAISFAGRPTGNDSFELDLFLEDDKLEIVGNHRFTEQFTFNISEAEFKYLSVINNVQSWFEPKKTEGWGNFAWLSGGPQDKEGINCSVITGQLLKELGDKITATGPDNNIYAFADCYSPMDISARFYELDLIKKALNAGSNTARESFDFRTIRFSESTSNEPLKEDQKKEVIRKALMGIVATENELTAQGQPHLTSYLHTRIELLNQLDEILKKLNKTTVIPFDIKIFMNQGPTGQLDLVNQLPSFFAIENLTTIFETMRISDLVVIVNKALESKLGDSYNLNWQLSELNHAQLQDILSRLNLSDMGETPTEIAAYLNHQAYLKVLDAFQKEAYSKLPYLLHNPVSKAALDQAIWHDVFRWWNGMMTGDEFAEEFPISFAGGKDELNNQLAKGIVDGLIEGIFDIPADISYQDFLNEISGQKPSDLKNAQNQVFIGTTENELIMGTNQNDFLIGGGGVDTLKGGLGHDTYIIGDLFGQGEGPGQTTIIDEDGMGEIIYARNGRNYALTLGIKMPSLENQDIWQDVALPFIIYKYDAATNTLEIIDISETGTSSDGVIAVIENYTKENELSLKLVGFHPPKNGERIVQISGPDDIPSDAHHMVIQDQVASVENPYNEIRTDNNSDTILGSESAEVIKTHGGNDYVVGGLGNDYIYGGSGNDYIVGGVSPIIHGGPKAISSTVNTGGVSDDDYLVGGAGQDTLIGGAGDDIIIAGESSYEEGDSDAGGDWAAGGEGNDVIFGSRDSDILMGGAGCDFIEGNGGNDIILGDGDEYNMAFIEKVVEYVSVHPDLPEKAVYSYRGYEFTKILFKDNEGLLWETKVLPDGTLVPTEITDEVETDPISGQPLIDPETGEAIIKEGFMLIYTPRGWTVVLEQGSGLINHIYQNNGATGGFRIDLAALADAIPGAHNDYLFGGAGDDMILGQVGNDIVDGGEGNDYGSSG